MGEYFVVLGVGGVGEFILFEYVFFDDGLRLIDAVLRCETAHKGLVHQQVLDNKQQYEIDDCLNSEVDNRSETDFQSQGIK